jgi:ABC-type microcin C transport system permease subunit YejE
VVLCHPARSQLRQAFVGAFIGVVAYEVAVACAALVEVWAWGKAAPGRYLMIVLVSTYLVLAMISVLYARSSPRQRLRSP